jgi:hypothetical protein
MCDSYLDCRAAAPGSGAHQQEHDDLIAVLEELFRLRDRFLERSQLILEDTPHFVPPTICPSKGVTIWYLILKVRGDRPEPGIPVPAAYDPVHGAKRLDIRL